MVFAEASLNYAMFYGGIAIISYMLLTRTGRMRRAKSKADACSPRENALRTAAAAKKPTELERWEVEMHDFARNVKGELDSKMVALSHLIDDAHEVLARLEAAKQQCDRAQGLQTVAAEETPAGGELPDSKAAPVQPLAYHAATADLKRPRAVAPGLRPASAPLDAFEASYLPSPSET